ncbi:MAG: type II secretion system F family protein [Anaerolineae bacterium]
MITALAVGATAALSVLIIFVGALRFIESQANPDQRLAAELARQRRTTSAVGEIPRSKSFIVGRLDRAISDRDFSDELARELIQADLRMTVSEYILIRAAVVLAGFLLGVLWTHNPGAGAILAVISFFLPRLYIRHRRSKRLEAFNGQLEDVLMLVVGALRAGHSFLQALSIVVDEIPPPASDEFGRIVREVGLGLTLPEALANLVRRIDSDDLDMIVTAVNIQQEVGGELAEILDTISETIRERVRIEGEIRVLTTQQRYTGYVLAGLPVGLGVLIYLLNPDYITPMFQPGWLLIVPAIALVLEFVGFLAIRRIVDIKV